MKSKTNQNQIKGILFVLPACLIVLIFIVYPVVETILMSFTQEDTHSLSLANYASFFDTKSYVSSIGYTLKIVLTTVVLNLFISLLLGLYLRFDKSKFSGFIASILPAPKLIPGIVAVYAFMTVIKNTGAITRLCVSFFGVSYRPDILFTATGIVLMNLWFNVPFSTMLLGSSLNGVRDASVESARDVGAGPLRVLVEVILPSISNTMLLVVTFTFMGNIGEFTTPFLMGENKVKMLGVVLYNEFSVFHDNYMAATISTLLFLFSSAVSVYYIRVNLKKDI